MAKVTISCGTKNANIRYTTDGTEPTENSNLYSSPLTIEGVTLKAKGFKSGLLPSNMVTQEIPFDMCMIGYGDIVIGFGDTLIGFRER